MTIPAYQHILYFPNRNYQIFPAEFAPYCVAALARATARAADGALPGANLSRKSFGTFYQGLGLVLKIAICPRARDFFTRQGAFPQQYFVYCREKQRRMAEKDPPFGHVVIFKTRPSITDSGTKNKPRIRYPVCFLEKAKSARLLTAVNRRAPLLRCFFIFR